MKDVELEALDSAFAHARTDLEELKVAIERTWSEGGRVFFCGCGATGRLSVSLESLYRKRALGLDRKRAPDRDDVFSFIAGGDYALVRSIENFEDHPEYGAQQLRDLGFGARDLLVATTEGGETPFVIGAAQEAATISHHPTWFLFCNPQATLLNLERCHSTFENKNIRSLSLATGPMALAGSTRLQASTVLMLAAGSALFAAKNPADPETSVTASAWSHVEEFRAMLAKSDFSVLAPLISREAEAYAKGKRCVHSAGEHAITVMTDTTERSPTFSIAPFENEQRPSDRPAWTYLHVPNTQSAEQAWEAVLMRKPRALTWKSVAQKYDAGVLAGFNFSNDVITRRKKELGSPLIFSVEGHDGHLHLSVGGRSATLPFEGSILTEHLLLKCAMNMSSTLVMGRLGRFESNLMLFVKASNNKLIDRSIRFIQLLALDRGLNFDYEAVCHALFEVRVDLDPEESIVLKTLDRLIGSTASDQSEQGRIA